MSGTNSGGGGAKPGSLDISDTEEGRGETGEDSTELENGLEKVVLGGDLTESLDSVMIDSLSKEAVRKVLEQLKKNEEQFKKNEEQLKKKEKQLKKNEEQLKKNEEQFKKDLEEKDNEIKRLRLLNRGKNSNEGKENPPSQNLQLKTLNEGIYVVNTNSASTFGKKDWFEPKFAVIHHRRPMEQRFQPVVLLWDGFRQFREAIKIENLESCKLDKKDCEFAMNLSEYMSMKYSFEIDRQNELKLLLRNYFDTDLLVDKQNHADLHRKINVKYEDGNTTKEESFSYILIEIMNEMMNSKSEPFFQNIAYYHKELQGEGKESLLEKGCRFPSMLLLFVGPYFSVCGAVVGTRVVVDHLTPYLPLLFDEVSLVHIAQVFRALRTMKENLKKYYEPTFNEGTAKGMFYPDLKKCERYDGKGDVEWSYTKYYDESGKKLMYRARTNDDDDVLVKFALSYCPEAHNACAEKGYAPKLIGYEDLGDYKLVVMEYIEGREFNSNGEIEEIKGELRNAVEMLHGQGYVHGDLRIPNVLVPKDKDEKVKILDFDWAGKAGEIRYPFFMNHAGITWPEGAKDGELIEQEHDWEFLCTQFGIEKI